ncbi:hypothetical protein [Coleofasciculus sp. FACHB-SPT36]|uniref:hypothetical protein n=1 Tax=Cyanophyceae TaxID=3028117 RepID=UPI00168ACDEC|nr:hypothetical protein [Coleofasciculus sp. FACHB-SPT36]MBD2542130.1 hypothetical protein [Coleofasciculus sp. FACHB-SPT36]
MNILELAKQGNPQAIAAMMNRQLQPKGITAKANIKDGCLQIMVESAQVLNQDILVAFLRKGVENLGAESIKKVKVYGRQTTVNAQIWSQEFEIEDDSDWVQQCELVREKLSGSSIISSPVAPTDTPANKEHTDLLKNNALLKTVSIEMSAEKVIEKEVINDKLKNEMSVNNKQAPEAIIGALFLVFLFGGCVYQVGSPWNCEQAREGVQQAQNDYDSNYRRQLAKV